MILLLYAGYKVSILEGKKKIDILQAVIENYYDQNHIFGADQGLNIAVGVFSPTSPNKIEPIDPTYGSIIVKKITRHTDENG